MALIGTAGHVDHGKTALIRALTGIDADRLPEEKTRGLTIDIGFAWIDLPEAGRVSIIDVPGHERFLTNMLVGALAMETALLCVAGDEGVMPQTQEHLQILELLPVKRLIVALTKCDLLDDDLRELAIEETQEWLASTRFAGAQVIPSSAVSGAGIDELKSALDQALVEEATATGTGWKLPIDRVFTVKGHGAVVTGSLTGGSVKVGDEAVVLPGGIKARVKAVHVHDQTVDEAHPGSRTALNLTGVKAEDLERGMLAAQPGQASESTVIDLKVEWRDRPKHGSRVRAAIGAADAVGKAFLNDADESLLQVVFEHPVASAKGMPVIIRRHSPPDLLGGGVVVNPDAPRRRKNASAPSYESGLSNQDALLQAVKQAPGGIPTSDVATTVGESERGLAYDFEDLLNDGQLLGFAGLWFTPENFEASAAKFEAVLLELHKEQPSRAFAPRELAVHRAEFKWAGKQLDRIISRFAAEGRIRVSGTQLAHRDFQPQLKPKQDALLKRIEEALDAAGLAVPTPKKLADDLNVPPMAIDQILPVGLDCGRLVRVEEGIYYTPPGLMKVTAQAREAFGLNPFSAAEFRDAMKGTRKYVIPVVEWMDAKGLTIRQGDTRRFRD
jgi:selenocysteine-specific elongation factor